MEWCRRPNPLNQSNYTVRNYSTMDGHKTCVNMSLTVHNATDKFNTGSYYAIVLSDCGSNYTVVFYLEVNCHCSLAPPSASFFEETEKLVYAAVMASLSPRNIVFPLKYFGCTSMDKYGIIIDQSSKVVCNDSSHDSGVGSLYTCTREYTHQGEQSCQFTEIFTIINYPESNNGLYCFQAVALEVGLNDGSRVCPLDICKFISLKNLELLLCISVYLLVV